MRQEHRRKYNRSNHHGYTLVELVVSMALTAILATAVASIMFPIVSIFMDMQKLSRAQMVADTVTDALRKECAASYVMDEGDVKVLHVDDPSGVLNGDGNLMKVLCGEEDGHFNITEQNKGNTLVFRINGGYAKALYWNMGISPQNYTDLLEENLKTGIVTSKAVYRLFSKGVSGLTEENMPMETKQGYVHCAYYRIDTEKGTLYPVEAYDYTNLFPVSAYSGFTVSVEYSPLNYETITDPVTSLTKRRPVYVVATVGVYEGDFHKQDSTLVYTRNAVLCFAEDNTK